MGRLEEGRAKTKAWDAGRFEENKMVEGMRLRGREKSRGRRL